MDRQTAIGLGLHILAIILGVIGIIFDIEGGFALVLIPYLAWFVYALLKRLYQIIVAIFKYRKEGHYHNTIRNIEPGNEWGWNVVLIVVAALISYLGLGLELIPITVFGIIAIVLLIYDSIKLR